MNEQTPRTVEEWVEVVRRAQTEGRLSEDEVNVLLDEMRFGRDADLISRVGAIERAALITFIKGADIPETIQRARLVLVRRTLTAERELTTLQQKLEKVTAILRSVVESWDRDDPERFCAQAMPDARRALKEGVTRETHRECSIWRDRAFETAAQIVDAYHVDPQIAADIRALKDAK